MRQPPQAAPETISGIFFDRAAATPEKIAIACEGREISYAQLAQLVARWSNALAANGVRRGDQIGVILPNNVEFVALILVAADLGAGLVPLSPALPPAVALHSLQAAQARHLVSTSPQLAALRAEPGSAAVHGCWLSIDAAGAGATTLEQLLQAAPADARPLHAGQADDALILTMTSGSTGSPKPIVLSQRTKLNRLRAAVQLYGMTAQDRTLAATPLYHSLAERLVLLPLLTGGSAVLMAHFSAQAWLRCVQAQRVSFTIAVSSQLKQIAAHMAQDEHDVSSLRCLVSSSALLENAVKADLLARFSCDFHECYGASEIAIATNLDGNAARTKLQSVGRAAPGVELRILGENDEQLPSGQAGEIVCKTNMLFGGYFQLPELTRAAMCGEYFRTGDIGKLDEDGYLYFLGRKKDVIITGGINVYPADIEAAIGSHGSVTESAAFAFPDARLGEVVAVALVVRDPASFDLRQLRFHCANALADFQQPRRFFVVEQLPKNSMGKLMKFQLVQTYASSPERE
ncbi:MULTISPECIES: class I adenylate-forming enzyme family protein [unclassified Janthinobacterium]|uniref:class I adenylate-forming enzyme family protein n=1 Tax=unclassified Janthinobacterium TaxID=2610881 RepID=UPI0002895900|nr:class I adenylate-forming enzyme family protein [Janthinobacterium sp. CG_23.4]MDH6157709.1 long-chain acyl-CoA synthetase [Janthinobacterium sp. CG_23.4]